MTTKLFGGSLKLRLAITCLCFAATHCHARIGETVAETETRYGKPLKDAKALLPATVAHVYQQKDIGYSVGFLEGAVVYEIVQEVEDDGDFGEDNLKEQEIETALHAQAPEWTQIKDNKDGQRHWKSADDKLVATYSKKQKALVIETAAFAQQRAAKKP